MSLSNFYTVSKNMYITQCRGCATNIEVAEIGDRLCYRHRDAFHLATDRADGLHNLSSTQTEQSVSLWTEYASISSCDDKARHLVDIFQRDWDGDTTAVDGGTADYLSACHHRTGHHLSA